MHQQRNSSPNTRNNEGNRVTQTENDNSPEFKLKIVEDCNLNDKECKIVVMKKSSEM